MNRGKRIKFALINSALINTLFSLIFKLYTKTLRIELYGAEKATDHLERGGRVILCCWHQRFFAGFFLPGKLKRNPVVMISQSDDGTFISTMARSFGWIPVRGSSSRGGRKALREMIRLLKQHNIGTHIADGPGGPPRVIKPGIVMLAKHTNAAICPIYVIYHNAWVSNSWDRFMVPKPGSRVTLHFGSLVTVPESLDSETLEDIRFHIEETMIHEYRRLDGKVRR